MFSVTDIQDLVRLFEPTILDDRADHGRKTALLPSESGSGFLAFNNVVHGLNQKFARETERVKISAVAQEFDISDAIVRKIIQNPPATALVSRDKQYIVPTCERQRILEQLLDDTSRGLVSKMTFPIDNNLTLESVDILVAGENERLLQLEHPQNRNPYLTSFKYQQTLDNEIMAALQISQNEARPTILMSGQLTGKPPLWYVSQRVDHVSAQVTSFHGRFELSDDRITYEPETFLVRVRDYALDQLRAGTISHSNLSQFAKALPTLYYGVLDVQSYFKASLGDCGSFASKYAISETWLEVNRKKLLQKLLLDCYIDVSSSIKNNFPNELQAEILGKETERIISSFIKTNNTNVSSVKQFLVLDDHIQELADFILHAAREQAETQWAGLEQVSEQEHTLVGSDIYESFSKGSKDQDHVEVLKAVFEKNEGRAKSAFAEKISELESQNETEFAFFWSDRVVTRFQVYRSGGNAITDLKLQSQLLELLQSHVTKELIPESIARAQTKGLTRSKKTKKNTQKLISALKSASDLQATSSCLDKFARKQGIASPSDEAVAEKKLVQLKELTRGMKKDADGPRLFLTLMVVLLANRQAGIVYATGKFAPKLMKLLKESMGSEEYGQLEKWKDAVKAGSLSAEDRAEIRALAVK